MKITKQLINQIFRSQIVISCGQKRTIISNGAGEYKYYNTQDIIDNQDTGNFYPYKTVQK